MFNRLYIAPCPVLSDPFRGSVNISTNGAVTTATYVCEDTYTLSGNETRICEENGEWSDSEPSCGMIYIYIFLF